MSTPRPATQAGKFYSAHAENLRTEVATYVGAAPVRPVIPAPWGFVAPHAGYSFSGQTAAHVYSQVRERKPQTVFVFAPSHYASFPLASTWDGPAYLTPLGQYPIDTEMVARLRRALPGLRSENLAERQEHSLEVQIPFLQVTCPHARLVPLLIGEQDWQNVHKLTSGILRLLDETGDAGERLAFVASSDAYHGHSLDACKASDGHLTQTLASMDVSRLYRDIQTGHAMACGYGPIAAVMEISKHLGARCATILHHATSAEAVAYHPGDYVVGYLSVMFH